MMDGPLMIPRASIMLGALKRNRWEAKPPCRTRTPIIQPLSRMWTGSTPVKLVVTHQDRPEYFSYPDFVAITATDPCAGLGGDTDGDTICDDNDNCPRFPMPTRQTMIMTAQVMPVMAARVIPTRLIRATVAAALPIQIQMPTEHRTATTTVPMIRQRSILVTAVQCCRYRCRWRWNAGTVMTIVLMIPIKQLQVFAGAERLILIQTAMER
jgi:hypothetical protein